MTGRRLLYLAALSGAFLFLLYYNGWLSALLVLFLLGLAAAVLLLSLPLRGKVCLSSEELCLPVQRAQKAVFTFSVQKSTRLPAGALLLHISCINRLTGEHFRQKLSFPLPDTGMQLQLPVTSAHCGCLELTVEYASVCDLLGLFSWHCHVLKKQVSLLVLPKITEVPLTFLSAGQSEEESGTYDSQHPGSDLSETFELRSYRPGDHPHSIHWKLSQKRQTLTVRQGSLPLPSGPDILVELSESSCESLDCAVETALTLSAALRTQGRRHRLLWLQNNTLTGQDIVNDEDADTAIAALLCSGAHAQALALAAWEAPAGRKLLYITTSVVSPALLPADAAVLLCGAEQAENDFIAIPVGKVAQTLANRTL